MKTLTQRAKVGRRTNSTSFFSKGKSQHASKPFFAKSNHWLDGPNTGLGELQKIHAKSMNVTSVQRKCTACEEDKLQKNEIRLKPNKERVWGFWARRSMCNCGPEIQDGIDNANHFSGEYQACNLPANNTPTSIEACVDARNPGSTTAGSTDSSGTITVNTPATTPCERILNRATRVHEVFHSRQADGYARSIGGAFYNDWQSLSGNASRLSILRSRYPADAAQFDSLWDDPQNWVDGEVESYTWERRFLVDMRRALSNICP